MAAPVVGPADARRSGSIVPPRVSGGEHYESKERALEHLKACARYPPESSLTQSARGEIHRVVARDVAVVWHRKEGRDWMGGGWEGASMQSIGGSLLYAGA